MERILLRNGIPEPMPRIEGTYLYQTLHVRGRRPLWLDRHTELLARWLISTWMRSQRQIKITEGRK